MQVHPAVAGDGPVQIISSATSTSSLTSLVARMYLTRNPASAAAISNPIDRWPSQAPESPDQTQRLPARTHAAMARVWIVAGFALGLASKSKLPSHFSRLKPAT
jgi:hypothetical protein